MKFAALSLIMLGASANAATADLSGIWNVHHVSSLTGAECCFASTVVVTQHGDVADVTGQWIDRQDCRGQGGQKWESKCVKVDDKLNFAVDFKFGSDVVTGQFNMRASNELNLSGLFDRDCVTYLRKVRTENLRGASQ